MKHCSHFHFFLSLKKQISFSCQMWLKWTSNSPEERFLDKHGVLGSINHLIKGRSHSSFKTKQLPLQVLLYPRPRPLQRRQEPQVSGKKAKQCVCSLLVGIITVPSAWRGSAGASQDTATALQHFPQINPVPAQSLVLIWTVSGLE